MIVITQPNATEEQIQRIVTRVREFGLEAQISRGASRVSIGVIGPEALLREKAIAAMPGVEAMIPVLKPYKLAARDSRGASSVAIGDVRLGENEDVVSITIANATRFVARSLAAGVQVSGAPAVAPPSAKLVWHDADSSMISAYAYNEAEGILEVAFHSTGVYRYFDVPQHIFEGLHQASSKGRYLRAYIMDMYHYDKKRGR